MFQGGLFTRDWLIEGVTGTGAWTSLEDVTVDAAHRQIHDLLSKLLRRRNPNEAETEAKLVWPVLEALGWDHVSVQQNMTVRGRKDVPDALLFAHEADDTASQNLEPWQRFRFGAALVEAKRWGRPLDREGTIDQGVPSTQLMHYLRRADDITAGKMRWGILTNGRQWRLYWQGAQSIAEDFFEIDLGKVFGLPGCQGDLLDPRVSPDHAFRLFLLVFGRAAFLPAEHERTFHGQALEDGRQWETRVARDLSTVVFRDVFPRLVGAIAEYDGSRPTNLDGAYLEAVRSTALILLYRLLFVLYAEDRNLLPDEYGPYADFSLTRLRQEIADRRAAAGMFSPRSHAYWARLETIFGAIAEGDDALGIPPYNGGLFAPATAPLIARVRLPDTVVAEIIHPLSHRVEGGRPRYINYRDLSVQQLGSIYESILEYAVEDDGMGGVRPLADDTARHRSGSYYTPEELVSLIIDRAVRPLVDERMNEFKTALIDGADGEALAALDPATRLLDLKIVDPAMGSGHFLVSLVDWLSDKVLTAIGEAELAAGEAYRSPLVDRIGAIRTEILGHAREHGWPIVEDQLDDRHIVRRMVLKRCVYGVDLNPMAVELAKVALWLHSFTVGAPLSFLDHHLRCGNSVLGAWVRPTTLWLANRGSLLMNDHLVNIDQVTATMQEIEATSDTDIAEVEQSKSLFGTVEQASAPLDALLSLVGANTLMGVADDAPSRIRESAEQLERVGRASIASMSEASDALRALKAKKLAALERELAKAADAERRYARAEAFKLVLEGSFGDPARIASGEIEIADAGLRLIGAGGQVSLLPDVAPDDTRRLTADALVREARELSSRYRFLNWEIAFPGVWNDLASAERTGGFDAVIGNPPYVRQEQIGDFKSALKAGFLSFAGTADLYVYFYEQGLKLLRPGGRMAYVVTNKWLKAGYAKGLRRLFAEDAWIEFLADFGHAKRFFPDADVFPSVLVVRRPDGELAPDTFDLAVIPRDDVPGSGLDEAVRAVTYAARRDQLTSEPWSLDPPEVAALISKLRERSVSLADYAGVRPFRGVLTGLNEAFLIDTPTKERLIAEDGRAAEIIKPYLRGQDIERWLPDWIGSWMIFARRGINIDDYPSIVRHLERYRSQLEPKPADWRPLRADDKWGGRKEGNYRWFEVQDSVDYWQMLEQPKIVYTDITWSASFSVDRSGRFINNTGYFLPTDDLTLAATLNAPIGWWYSWRRAQHGKDEALRYFNTFVEDYPIPAFGVTEAAEIRENVEELSALTATVRTADQTLAHWLRVEQGIAKLPSILAESSRLGVDAFAAAVRAALPRREGFGPVRLARVRDAFLEVAEPARAARGKALNCELALSSVINRSYGLSDDEVALMWRTAPPRMPIPAPNNEGEDSMRMPTNKKTESTEDI
jgi:hypothetical protein